MSILRDMSEDSRVQYKFMIPTALKARLEDAAHNSRRSLSAEIIERLEASLTGQGQNVRLHYPPLGAIRPPSTSGHLELSPEKAALLDALISAFAEKVLRPDAPEE